ncbi:uncharacterized protein SAPINGB_P005527 [Magnusiomyces paraingens]|uniref:Pheromone alpha factor receptor n=1 Tax=Magnusiomyces paraingens TaxID=2606893 RepID=A0A5E8C7A6_9ASCO|nr:uncharacterized protein SAPINGB_P005527 [Saprochaete ingens]VVT57086.1 unnamed protein product [Saprochaete ingens]
MDSGYIDSETIIQNMLAEGYTLLNQTIEIMTIYGPAEISLTEIDEFYKIKILMGIFFGLRVGASAVVAIILFLITENKRTPVFIFNQISLIILFIQSSLYLQYLNSSYSFISTNFTGSYEAVTSNDTNISIASSVFQFLLICAVTVSLFFQVRVVFPPFSMARVVASIITGVASVLCCIINLLFIISRCASAKNPNSSIYGDGHFANILPTFSQYTFAATIMLCSVTLLGKLVFAIRTRRILGLRQFGPLEIIVIMSVQTMIIPVILYIINNTLGSGDAGTYVAGVGALAPLSVVIFLPMSSMWASAANTNAISRQEMIFNNHRNSQICSCGRPKNGDDDDDTFDYRSHTTSYHNRKMDKYYSETEKNTPNTTWGRLQKFFIKVERGLHHALTYKSRKAVVQAREQRQNDLELMNNRGSNYEATTKLSISNINPHNNVQFQQQANPFSGIHAGNISALGMDDMSKRSVSLSSPNPAQGTVYYESGIYDGSAGVPVMKEDHLTSVQRVSSHSESSTPEDDAHGGIIISKSDINSPTDTVTSNATTQKIMGGQAGASRNSTQVFQFNYDENRNIAYDDDLLSLNGDENDEEYYHRMKSKYNSTYLK